MPLHDKVLPDEILFSKESFKITRRGNWKDYYFSP